MQDARIAKRLIVALDFTTLASALAMAERLRGLIRTVKVGSALFTACGPEAIRRLRVFGFDVMLDLKFLDIPSTVELSCRSAVHHRVSMVTVHACGARAMLEAAVQGVRAEAIRLDTKRPLIFGVTVLTSARQGTARSLTRRVMELARVALNAGCDGVVASAQEVSALRRRFGQRLQIVCPGIRPGHASHAGPSTRFTRLGSSQAKLRDDQRRVCTPGEAIARGADVLVVGRPIIAARNPRLATQQILDEMKAASRC